MQRLILLWLHHFGRILDWSNKKWTSSQVENWSVFTENFKFWVQTFLWKPFTHNKGSMTSDECSASFFSGYTILVEFWTDRIKNGFKKQLKIKVFLQKVLDFECYTQFRHFYENPSCIIKDRWHRMNAAPHSSLVRPFW